MAKSKNANANPDDLLTMFRDYFERGGRITKIEARPYQQNPYSRYRIADIHVGQKDLDGQAYQSRLRSGFRQARRARGGR